MRTIKQLLNSGEQINEYSILLKNGQVVDGFLVQERVDKENDNEGYNVYDIRTTWTDDDIELYYGSLEPNVWVDWADSIATKQTIDFGDSGCLEIDNDDYIEWKRNCPDDMEELFDDFDSDTITISDFNITYKGSQIDTLVKVDDTIKFYGGNPTDGGDFVEILPTSEEKREIFDQVIEMLK